MPGNDVKRRVRLLGLEEGVVELGGYGVLTRPIGSCGSEIFAKARQGGLEVSRVRETIGSDRAELRQGEVALVELEGISPDRTGW